MHQALVAPPFRSLQKILAVIDALDLEFLAWLNAVLLANAAGKTICPLLEIMVFMISKISSYLACVKPDSMAQKPSRAKGGLLRPAGTNRCQELLWIEKDS